MTRAHSCARCKRAAFDAESVDVDARTRYHAACFKCADCGARCAIATFVKIGEEVYCRRHALERDVRRKPALGADALEIATYANRRTTTAREWVKMETEGAATGRGTSATARATGGDRGARDGGADAVGVRAVRKGGVPDRVGGRRREEVAPGGVF